jgi:hypothetical protein
MAKVGSAACVALKEALVCVYWYKGDLRSFLAAAVSDPARLKAINWGDPKRDIVERLVDELAERKDDQRELSRLMSEVTRLDDFSHLATLDGGNEKMDAARKAVATLRRLTGHDSRSAEQKKVDERRRQAHLTLLGTSAVRRGLEHLAAEFLGLLSEPDARRRGARMEELLRALFELCGVDPNASFKIAGEQIDGAFTFERTNCLFVAKWQQGLVSAADLDILARKVVRTRENTLGLILSVYGFADDGIKAHSSGRRAMALMDGSDLMAVLESRIDLVHLLERKRQAAVHTGNIYLKVHDIL